MAEPRPQLRIIAGPNGSGKTTFVTDFLPRYARVPRFVNADLIAAGLSPFAPEAAALTAGRLGSVVNNLANEPRPAKLGIAFSVLPGLRGR